MKKYVKLYKDGEFLDCFRLDPVKFNVRREVERRYPGYIVEHVSFHDNAFHVVVACR